MLLQTVCEGPVIEGMGAGPVADAGQWDYYKVGLQLSSHFAACLLFADVPHMSCDTWWSL